MVKRVMDIGRTAVGLLALTMIGYTVYTGNQATAHLKSVTECQAAFNTAYNSALIERSNIADRWRDDQIVYLDIVADSSTTQEQRHDALDTYRESLKAAAKQRDEAPLPKNPRCS